MDKQVYITAISVFLPNDPVSNDEMESVLGQVGEKPSKARKITLRSNGIKSRYYALDKKNHEITHTNTELTALAVKELAKNGFDINTIEVLACGTTLPDQMMPNHAVMVHGELNIPHCEVVAMSGICLSGIMALKYAYMSVLSGQSSIAVATGSENVSSLMRSDNFNEEIESRVNELEKNPQIAFDKDFLRWMLSDGAGAILLNDKPVDNGISLRIDWIDQKSYANELETCMYAGAEKNTNGKIVGWREMSPENWLSKSIFSIKQDIKLLDKYIVPITVERPLVELIKSNKLIPSEIDYFLPHYSSKYFEDKLFDGLIRSDCNIPKEKWFTNLTTKGNTGSASIYIILEELFNSGSLQKGEKLLCYIPESGRFSSAFIQLTVV